MKGKSPILIIAGISLFLGVYLFPFGGDAIYSIVINTLGGGDYWTGMWWLYIISGAMIFFGLLISKPNIIYSVGGSPFLFLIGYVVLMVVCYYSMKMVSTGGI